MIFLIGTMSTTSQESGVRKTWQATFIHTIIIILVIIEDRASKREKKWAKFVKFQSIFILAICSNRRQQTV